MTHDPLSGEEIFRIYICYLSFNNKCIITYDTEITWISKYLQKKDNSYNKKMEMIILHSTNGIIKTWNCTTLSLLLTLDDL